MSATIRAMSTAISPEAQRAALRPLLDERAPADALAVYYALQWLWYRKKLNKL